MSIDEIRSSSWRTTAAGALCILVAGAGMFGVTVPGFNADPGTLLTLGLGLMFAKDAAARK